MARTIRLWGHSAGLPSLDRRRRRHIPDLRVPFRALPWSKPPLRSVPYSSLLERSVFRERKDLREDRVPRVCQEAGFAPMLPGLQGLFQKMQYIRTPRTDDRLRSSRGDMQYSIDDHYGEIVFRIQYCLPNLRISRLGHCRRTVERTLGDHLHFDNSNSRRLPLIAFQNIELYSDSLAERLSEKN